jgi:hypothetical protein
MRQSLVLRPQIALLHKPQMRISYRQNNNWQEGLMYSKKSLPQCLSFHTKFNVDCPKIEPRSPHWEVGEEPHELCYGHDTEESLQTVSNASGQVLLMIDIPGSH